MDTQHDYRILLAEDAVSRLTKRVRVWNLPYPLNKGLALQMVSELRSLVKKVRYSFLPLDMLLSMDELRRIEEVVQQLAKLILPPLGTRLENTAQRMAVAEIRYSLWTLLGLRSRLALGEENLPEYAVDVVGMEVGLVQKHPSADRLWVLKVGTPRFSLTVVTNLESVKKGEVRGVAILPPTEFFGVVSEGMICSDPLDRTYVGKRVPRELIHRAEIVNVVERIARNVGRGS